MEMTWFILLEVVKSLQLGDYLLEQSMLMEEIK